MFNLMEGIKEKIGKYDIRKPPSKQKAIKEAVNKKPAAHFE